MPKYTVIINGEEKTIDKDKFDSNIEAISAKYPDAKIKAINGDEEGLLPVSNYSKAIEKGYRMAELKTDISASRFVKGKGKDTTIFGVPYSIYTQMKPESQSHYYQNALDNEKRSLTENVSQQAGEIQMQAEDAYDKRYNKLEAEEQQFSKEHPFVSFIKDLANAGRPVPIPPTMEDKDVELRTLQGVVENARTTKQTIEEAGKKGNTTFVGGLGRGMRDMAGRGSTWDMGVLDLNRNFAVSTAADKYLKGEELNDTEKLLLRGAAIEHVANNEFAGEFGRGYKMGQTTVQSLPFMAEFLINPLSGSGKAIGKGMLKQGLKVVGKELPAGMLGKVVNGTTRIMGDVAAASGMALTTGSARTAADFIDRQNGVADYEVDGDGNIQYSGQEGGVGVGEATYKAIASQTIENLSEMAGGYFNVIGKGVGNLAGKTMEKSSLLNRLGKAISTSKVADLYRNISSSQLAKTVTDFERNTGYHGTIEEYAEEVVGTVLNAIFTGDQSFTDLGDMNQQIDTFLGVCGIGGLFSTIKAVGYRTPVHQANRELGKIGKQLSHSMGDEWSDVSQALQDASVEDRKQYLANIIERDDISDETKLELFQYVGALTRIDAIKSGKVKQVSEGEENADNVIVDDEAEESYEAGYNAANPQEKNEAKLLLEQSTLDLQRLFGLDKVEDAESVIADFGDSPAKVIMSMTEKGYSQDDISLVTSFLNAKETYNGVIDNVKDGIDNEIATQLDYIDKNTHQDGSLYNATMKVDDRKVYVTGGNLVLDEENNIDHKKSDTSIVVRDASTGKIDMVDVRDILSVESGVNAEQHKVEIAEQIRQDYAQRAADEINGVLSFAPGDVYDVIHPATGQLSPINIIQDNGDGTVIVADASGIQSQSTREEIQAMVEQTNIAKMNERRLSQQPSKYALNNEVIIQTKEGSVRGSITAEKDADGLIEVVTESPINGKKVNVFTEEELEKLTNDVPLVDDIESSAIIPEQEVQESVATVQVKPESAVASEIQSVEEQSIPVDDKGNILYHKAPVELTLADLNDGNLTTDEVDAFVSANKEEAAKLLKKTSEKPPKIGTNKAKYLEEKKKWADAVADINSQVSYWNEIEAQMQAIREQPGDVTAGEIKAMGEPLNGSELAAMMLGNGKLPLLYNDYKRETGFSNADARGMFGMFSTKKNGGMTVEQAGEQLMLADMEAGTNFFDQDDPNAGRNAILDVLSSARTRGGLIDYIKNNREAMAERERQAEAEADELAREQWFQDNFHMTYEEYQLWDQGELFSESNMISDEEYQEFMSMFVDEILNKQENDRRTSQESGRGIAESESNEQGRISGVRESGSPVLQGEESISSGTTGRIEEESTQVDADGSAEHDALQGSPSGGELTSSSRSQENVPETYIPSMMEGESLLDYASRVNEANTLHKEEQKVDTNPTDAQKEVGNYRKGHIKIDGFDITIENPVGSERSGVDADGNPWSIAMNNTYGYIRGTEGVDGDHIDIFLGNSGNGVYVVDQVNEDGSFDEHKVMYGFNSMDGAKEAYLSNYSPGWRGLGNITGVSKETFKEWVDSSHRKTKPFAEYKIVRERAESKPDVPTVLNNNVYGKQNKLVSNDRYEDLKAKLRGKFGQMNAGFDPELFAIGAEMAAYHIEAGTRKFSDFAKRMVADVGDSVRPYLKSFYEGARQFPGMEGYHKEMDAYDVVIDFDTDKFDKVLAEDLPIEIPEKKSRSHGKSLTSQKAPASMQDMFNQNINSDGRTERNQTTDREVGEGPREESEGAERRRTDRGSNGDNVSDTERGGGVSTLASGKRSKSNVRRNLHNFSFGEKGIDVPAGEVGKLKANIEAIQTLRQIEESGEAATDEQKAILARYVGWGGLSNALDESKYALKDSYWNTDRNWNAKYLSYYEQLKALLSPEEFRSAVQSTTTSHYTPELIIRGLWKIADELGFKGGNVSEPAMGVGHIFGLMPGSIAERSQISGFEIDSLSGRISKLLYPDADVKVQGYETAFSPQSKDLVITNVPFGKDAPYDKGLDKTLRKKLRGAYNLHNYFIAKSLLELKDGGLGVFVTSSATMDGADSSFREFISETGIDLIGAIRLPNDAFQKNAGTSVTSDVLVFRRRKAGEASNGINFISNTTIGEGKYVEKNEERTKPIMVNEYFAEHPDMMLGDMMTAHEAGSGGLYSGASQTLKARPGMNLSEEMNKAIERLPKDLVLNDVTIISHSKEQTDLPNGTITVKDGKVYVSMRGELEAISTKDSFVYEGKTRKTADAINDYTDLKSTLRRLISAEQSTDVDPEPIRQELNQKYDAFVPTYGTLNRNKALNEILIEDFEHNLPFSLEDVKKVPSSTGKSSIFKVSKGNGILAKRISFPMEEPKDADNLLDAVNISRSYRGSIDLPYVSQLLGKDVEEITEGMLNEGLAYRDPISAKIIDKETYLSGNVKEKLEQATIAVESNPEFQKNIVDLTAVQPEPVRFGDISYRLGTTWIPAEYIDKFAEDVLGIVDSGMNFIPTLNEWVADKSMRAGDFAKYGLYRTDRLSTADLFVAALNQRKPKVYDEITIDHNQKTRVVNEAETQAATEKIMELSDKFIEYIDSQKAIHKDLERIYNDKYNNYRLTTYQVPAFEHYPNSNNNITLRVHQTKAVQRGLSESVLLAHQVGTGKTFTMVTLAMEMRRLNIAKKPMIVVQNATLEDFVSDFYKLYPGANLLSPGEKERSAENRKRLFNLIATGDFDAIIIPQSFLQFIPDSEERKKALIQEKIEQFEHVIGTTDDANLIRRMQKEIDNMRDEFEGVEKTKKRSVKDKARTADRIKSKIERNLDRRTDDVMTFEQMGIDALFIDEAHNFKKIGFASKMSNVKGIDTSASQRANSLLLKAKWIQERNNQRNVVLATGTPITNTMAEVWTMMNFVAPDILESYHIQTFDEFATTFGTVEPSLEFTATGNFKIADRFKSYVNVPELVKAFRSHTDVVLTEDIPEFKENSSIPKLRDGMFTNVVIDKNEDLEDTMQTLINELAEFSKLSGREKKAKSALPLVVFTKAKQAAIDLRLLNPAFADNPNSKTNQVVSNVIKFYKESQEEKGTQLIFCDSYQSPGERPQMDLFGYDADVPRFNLYDDIKNKLISEGIPAKEIAIVNNYDGERRKALFEKVRNGEVRVLLGSTEKMGVGVNVQERLYALHHIDAPLRPMDFEQRNGRILRQGNNYALWNKPVNVVTYGVQGTLDATAYDRLRIKQNFINQMMKGDVTDRTMEENDDENPSGMTFNQMAATLSGDETAKLLFVAENKLKKLRNLKRSDANSKSGMADTIEFTRNWILKLEGKKSTFERAKDIVDKYFPDGVKDITVDGKVIKEKFSSALDPIIESYDEAYSVNRGIAPLKLLLNGGNAEVIIHFNEGRMVYELFTGKEHFIESRQFNGGKGLMSSIDYQLKAVEDNLSSIVGEISKFQKKIEGLTSAMSTPWGKEDELKQAEVDVEELRKKLEEKAKSNDDENKRYRMAEEPIGGYGSVSDYKAVTTKKHTQSEVGLSHPVYTSNNVTSEIYGNSAKFMKFLNGYSTSGFGKGDGKINMEKATAFYHDFKVQANDYKQSLYDIRSESSLAAREIVDEIIADVDYALDYYKRLAKGEDVWRTEKAPRYKEYNPIQQLSDDIQSLVSVEDERAIQDEAQKLADILHTPIRIVNSQELTGRNAKVKGWFDTKSGEVVIVIDNARSVPDVRQTIFHEIVGHNGLRTVLGNKFDEFIERVFHGANQSTRQKIVELAAKNNWNFHLATEEYLAQMAEKGFESNRGFWAKVRSIFMNIIHEAKLRLGFRISDNDLAYVLWRTYQLQTEGKGILQDATKIDMERRLRVGNFSKRNGRLLFRDGPVTESTVESGMARSLYELQTKKKSYKFKEAYQDSMLGLKKFMEAVSMATGEDIADHENAYMAENQMSSRSTYETEFYKDNFFTPMMKAVTALINKGFEYNEVVDYLVAKHGLERNRELSVRDAILSEYKDEPEEIKRLMNEYHEQRDKVMELFNNGIIKKEDIEDKLNEVAFLYTSRISDYSGLSSLTGEEEEYENAARTLVSDMEEDNLEEIQVLWDKVNAATKEILRKNYDSGMMTKETYEKVSSMFMNYIPLRGWKEDTAADVYSYLISERSIFNAPVKAAVGRKSLADDPLATIGNMAESAILQGNRNLMKQKFLNLVINHPTELATVKEMWYVLNESTDEWEQSLPNIPDDATPEEVQNVIDEHERRMLELIRDKRAKKGRLDVPYKTLPPERKEHTVVVKRNGKEFTIFINGNPRVAQAVNGLTNPDATNHKLVQWVGRLNRQMAANFTTRNPAFVLSNLSRDLIFSSTAVAVKENREYSARFMKNVAANLKDMCGLMQRHERGTLNLDNRKDRYFHEFLQYGGETGYTNLHSVDEYKKLVDRQIMDAQGKVDIGRIFGLKSGKLTTTTTLGIVPTFQFVAKWTEFGNRCAEDMSRFATYMTSREMGRSVLRSISDAKEVTVNFNKKGAGGYGATTFKNLYLFFNAAVQSLQNFGGLAKKNPKKFAVALSSFTAAGVLLPMLNQMLISMFGDDDDKDAYNNLPEWVRKNNLCFWTGGKKFITIPLPIELRAFYGTGEIFHSLMNGDNVGRNWGMELVGQFTELLPINPLGNTDAISTIVPDAGKPLYQAMINKDYFGSPIYKDSDFNKLMPEWTKAYAGTSKALVSSTELLNELTGGDKYSRGWLNTNPALIEHYFESYFGGMGKTINQLGKTISMIWDEDERITRNIPVANRFFSNENERNAFSRVNEEYYHFLEEFKETGQRLRGYEKEADMGILEYAEKEDFLYNSLEYQRYEIMKDYQKDIMSIQDEIKETEDKPARKDLELLLNLTKMELVDELRNVK